MAAPLLAFAPRRTFRERFWAFVDRGFSPRNVAGLLIAYRFRFVQDELPENRPPSDLEQERHVLGALAHAVLTARAELRLAGFWPTIDVPVPVAWCYLFDRMAEWGGFLRHAVHPRPDEEPLRDAAADEIRRLWNHGLRCAKRAGIIRRADIEPRFRKGVWSAVGRAADGDLAHEWLLITHSPHKTLFRWKQGRLVMSDWAVRDAHPLKMPRRRQRAAPRRPEQTPVPDTAEVRILKSRFVRAMQEMRDAFDDAAERAALDYVLRDLAWVGKGLAGRARVRRNRIGSEERRLAALVGLVADDAGIGPRRSRDTTAEEFGVSVKAMRNREPRVRQALAEHLPAAA